MTQQELIQEFKGYPRTVQSDILEELTQIYDENSDISKNGDQISVEEKNELVESLAGVFKMKDPPMTKEEVRDFIYEQLAEKHK